MLLETVAVALALAYVVLAIKERRSCWLAAAASAALYIWIFSQANLYMEAALQVFYIGMAAYGWRQWQSDDHASALSIQRWSMQRHVLLIAIIGLGAGICGFLLSRYTEAAMPYLDSGTTIAALVTTWLVANKVLENWLYWIVIDAASVYLYGSRTLDLTAALYAGYVVLALAGYWQWRVHYDQQAPLRMSR